MEPPTGTVTFLFTDIEGSTRRWEAQTAEMRSALAAHDATLRRAIEAHGGWLFKHTGDGVVAAFSSPAAGVAAAAEAQRGLELPVRMGLATGEAEFRDADYFGPTLNRAARVMAAGHGGQVLLAQSTAALVDGFDLLDLGEHRLRDLSTPQRLFQLRAEGLRESFPPLRTLTSVPGNLPAQVTSFVGRAEELRRVVEALRTHRLVTLTGVGGVGKTRLALHAAAELAPGYPGGAWLVELAPVTDPGATGHAVAAVLGIAQQAGKTIGESVVEALRYRQVLVVLDNCEHLIEAVAGLAAEILEHCPEVTLLATSREALMIDGEQTWPVPSLGFREGVASAAAMLFADRARGVMPAFDVEADGEAVGEICRRLDGLPLAIELAAARVRSMSPGQIRDRLGERFRLLTGGSRRALERHQTLRHAVQWSYDLLGEEEKRLLARLSVFAGGFALEAAEEVCGADNLPAAAIDDLLDSLVRKTLVTAERAGAEMRYGLLETIRQFAEEQLGAGGEGAGVRDRHARYFAGAAHRNYLVLMGPGQPAALPWFDREMDNLRTAFRWSLDRGDPELAARIAIEAGHTGWLLSNYEPALWAIEILGEARATGLSLLPDLLATAAFCLYLGRFEEAHGLADEAIRLVEDGGFAVRSTLPWLLRGLASGTVATEGYRAGAVRPEDRPWPFAGYALAPSIALLDGQVEEGCALAERLLAEARSAGMPLVEALELHSLGLALQSSDLERAIVALEESVRISREHGATFLAAIATRELADFLGRSGNVRAAAASLLGILGDLREAGDWFNARYALMAISLVLARTGRYAPVAMLSPRADEAALAETYRERLGVAAAASREALGSQEFARLATSGAAMRPWDLIQYAREQLRLVLVELGPETGS